ncbi:phosphatidylserine decarboxylase [Bacillus massilinigeriensis]|uniref:phosphatidylserine decarboxylase n=1 Tax=Bacillus massilionigeriensis TaxID=1805475 RepID=UPI00096B2710|nr:phosphatidylserine decarboxylase [Bacillus massilionigeriensis]
MFQIIYRIFIELTNRKWTSNVLKRFAMSKLSKVIVPSFTRAYKINMDEMEKPLQDYSTLHEFFTRKLKAGARPIDLQPLTVISPVDGVIEDIGVISKNQMITVKGKDYSISEMVGNDQVLASFQEGIYMILYLSPSHYHRIHSPISGRMVNRWTIGNRSYPVNKWGLKYGKSPLSKNYRVITEIKHPNGELLLVKVGAMFVNSIEMVHEQDQLTKGDEVAFFSFGSTVVLLFEKDFFEPSSPKTPRDVKVGEIIGSLKRK